MPVSKNLVLLAFALLPLGANAQLDSSWSTLTLSTALDEKTSISVELQERLSVSELNQQQWLVRPSINYKLGKGSTISAGLFYGKNSESNRYESRLWQQYQYATAKGNWNLNLRTRLEQRQIEQDNSTSNRIRQRLRAEYKLTDSSSLSLSKEWFLNLDNTSLQREDGLSQRRVALGVVSKLSNTTTGEIALLNQSLLPNGEKREAQVITLSISKQF